MKIITTKKRVACLVGLTVGATLLIGGTGASMVELITPSAASHISNSAVEWKIDLVDAKPLAADLSPGAPVATLDLTAKNAGTLPANVALAADQSTLADLDLSNPLVQAADATVTMQINGDSARTLTWHGDFTTLVRDATVMDQTVAPGDTVSAHVTVTPVSTDTVNASNPVAASDQSFKLGLLFAQGGTDGDGQLIAVAKEKGNRLDPAFDGDGGWLAYGRDVMPRS